MPTRTALLVFEGISPFHLSIPCAVFGEARPDIGLPPDEIVFCAVAPGVLRTAMGLELHVSNGLEALAQADRIIIPSWHAVDQRSPPELTDALLQAHRRGACLAGLCLGAFPIADTGLLDGRTATTHWAWADRFGERFPAVTLDPGVLYIDHGDVVTSAGTAAALDCCLHLFRRQHGAELANRLARRLVIPPHRQGSQAQYVEQPAALNAGPGRIAQTLEWAQARLQQKLDIDTLAQHAAMSRRTFTRHMQKATGMSFVQWLAAQRLFLAQRLLETSDLPIEEIATCAGFGNTLSLRQVFAKCLHTTPTRYRQEFAGQTSGQ